MPEIRIGISGWTYPPWRKVFFPEGLPQRRELEYASRSVNSIEINGTFYALQKPESYRKWSGETPEDFVFSVKANRYITHIRRLRDVAEPVARFLGSGLLELGPKLGPILWQFPPSFVYDKPLVEAFFKLLPHDAAEARAFVKRHHSGGSAGVKGDHPLRHAMEVRHGSFENEEFIGLLRDHHVAIVVADTAGKWPVIEDVTADFVYVRLHGEEELYASGYTEAALKKWGTKVHRWSEGGSPRGAHLVSKAMKARKSGRDVFVYFDNDVKTRAPFDAMALSERLGVKHSLEAFAWDEREQG